MSALHSLTARLAALVVTIGVVVAMFVVGAGSSDAVPNAAAPDAQSVGGLPLDPCILPVPLPTCTPTSPSSSASPTATCTPPPVIGILMPCPPVATTPVTIPATPAPTVGATLTATAPTWSDPNGGTVSTAYQWYRAPAGTTTASPSPSSSPSPSGTAISGETKQTYTVLATDVGQQLYVVATGTSSMDFVGQAPGTSTSNKVTVGGELPKPSPAPAITGTPRVGQTLLATPGKWGADPQPDFTYQWYSRNGRWTKIAGAMKASYTVANADVGRKLAVVVTAKKDGYKDGVAVSNVVGVPKGASTTSLAAPHQVKPGRRIEVTAGVKSNDSTPSGRVRILEGATSVGSARLTSASGGVVRFTINKLSAGSHRLVAVYAGNSQISASKSRSVTVKVSKKH